MPSCISDEEFQGIPQVQKPRIEIYERRQKNDHNAKANGTLEYIEATDNFGKDELIHQ